MKANDMTVKELEEQIKQKIEVDNINAIKALKAEQKEELKVLRAELAKKKRQEFAKTVDDVGIHVVKKFDIDGHHNHDMTTEDYISWIDNLVEFYESHTKENREY